MMALGLKRGSSRLLIPRMEDRSQDIILGRTQGAFLNKYQDYLTYSKTCTEIARTTADESQRIMLLHIAETWRRLAASETQPAVTLH